MKWVGLLCAACAALIACSDKTLANDSSANQTAGGLVLTKTDAIAMRSEELRISAEKISVIYEFQNITDRDVTLTVAFPLPDVDPDYYNSDSDRSIVGEEFETTIDGVSVSLQAERKAYLRGKDITAKLTTLGLSPDQQITIDKLEKMPKAAAHKMDKTLVGQGLMEVQRYVTGRDERRPQWTYRRRFYREQVFPAGKTVVVTHRYTPSVGTSLSLPDIFNGRGDDADGAGKKYCIEKDIVRTVNSPTTPKKRGYIYVSQYIDYILSSGANWAGGKIGEFRLVIDKGAPENLISLCGTGIRKISPTEFEMRKRDFQPRGELSIAIFEFVDPNPEGK